MQKTGRVQLGCPLGQQVLGKGRTVWTVTMSHLLCLCNCTKEENIQVYALIVKYYVLLVLMPQRNKMYLLYSVSHNFFLYSPSLFHLQHFRHPKVFFNVVSV